MTYYVEKLGPAWWLVVATGLLVPATLLIFLPLNWILGLSMGLALWGLTLALLWGFAPSLRVENGLFLAGKARIELNFVGEATAFAKDEARNQKGPDLDARAWLVMVPWVEPVAKITIRDPQDPTPYWLVSSRRPTELIDALARAKKAT